MSKERLEEIKLLVEELTYEYVHDDTFYGLFVDIDRESIDFLIEQAEIGVNADKDKQALIKSNIALNKRVEELEAQNEGRELAHKLVVRYAKESEKQNKRYREALEKIAYDDEVLSNTEDIVIAIEALEGEE